jgi:ribonuclease HI
MKDMTDTVESATSYRSSLSIAEVLRRFKNGPQTGVFTDGGAQPNPGPGGWGFVYVVDGKVVDSRHGHSPATTNNRMELTALIEAYRSLPLDADVDVYSDSNLCVQTVNQWAKGWERNGWKRKTGPIANLELVQALYDEQKKRANVRLKWIKAHNGWLWNEYADSLASAWARTEL